MILTLWALAEAKRPFNHSNFHWCKQQKDMKEQAIVRKWSILQGSTCVWRTHDISVCLIITCARSYPLPRSPPSPSDFQEYSHICFKKKKTSINCFWLWALLLLLEEPVLSWLGIAHEHFVSLSCICLVGVSLSEDHWVMLFHLCYT